MQAEESMTGFMVMTATLLAGESEILCSCIISPLQTLTSNFYFFRVPNSGSFIRPSGKLSFGSSFLQAIKAKYVADDDPTFSTTNRVKGYGRKNLADIEIEVPNMESVIRRFSQLHKLREVGLGGWKREATDFEDMTSKVKSYAEVAFAFDYQSGEQEGDIEKCCPSIRGLDLSRSLLPTWLELSRITIELPYLESLLLHFNRFSDLSTSTMPLPGAFSLLCDLRVDGTLITWNDVLLLSESFPNLESLQMGSNKIKQLSRNHNLSTFHLKKLKILNLEENLLSDWSNIWTSLEACPNLNRLILSSNCLTQLSKCSRKKQENTLHHISLWDNAISAWLDLDALDASIGGLQSLVMGGSRCVFLKDIPMQDVRLIAIARLATLTSFNNAPIQPIERREAELFYVSLVAKEGLSEEEKRVLHPRHAHLIQLHDVSPKDTIKEATTENETLKSKLLTLKVHLSCQSPFSNPPHVVPAPASFSTQYMELSVLTTMPLRLLKNKLARCFSLKKGGRSIKSIWALLSPTMDHTQTTAELLRKEMRPEEEVPPSNERITFEMDNYEKDLREYNFFPGDEIVLVINED